MVSDPPHPPPPQGDAELLSKTLGGVSGGRISLASRSNVLCAPRLGCFFFPSKFLLKHVLLWIW